LRPLFSLLKQGGFAPRCVVDVGANKGIWTRQAMKYFPDARYIMVEPQEWLKENSSDLFRASEKITWINAGVADKSGTMVLHVSRRDDSSSLAPHWGRAENEPDLDVSVEVTTLNDIVASYCSTTPDMVKIDAEGFDLKVLAGASNLLGRTDIFLVEALIFPTTHENTLSEVLRTMTNAGYRSVEVTDINRSPKYGIAWLCEIAFLRNGCQWLDGVKSYE
jgi:FkbM family methyltransferase